MMQSEGNILLGSPEGMGQPSNAGIFMGQFSQASEIFGEAKAIFGDPPDCSLFSLAKGKPLTKHFGLE